MEIKKEYVEYAYFGIFIIFVGLFFTGTFGNATGLTLVVIDNSDPNSMFPTYFQGDLFIIHHSDPSKIELGDVIVYDKNGGEKVIHRVIDILKIDDKYFYRVKGDNPKSNPTPDQIHPSNTYLIPYDMILGKVIIRMPYLGHLSLAMQRNVGIRILVYLLAFIIAVAIVFWPEDEEEKEKKDEHYELSISSFKNRIIPFLGFPKKLIYKFNNSPKKIYIASIGLLCLLLLLIPAIVPNFLPTKYDQDDIGVTDIGINSTTVVPLNDKIGNTNFSGVFMQARITIYDNAGIWTNVKEFTLEIFEDANDKSSRISKTVWNSLHAFKGSIMVGGSVIIDVVDVPVEPTSLDIVVTLKIRNFYQIEYLFFTTSFDYIPK